VGILSDSHAYGKNSWWRQTILAGAVPGLRPGPFESYPGAQTAGLVGYLDAAVKGADLVVVQAGTNDLLRGKSPEEAAQGVYTLWDGIRARGASPVAALVPPSDTRPSLAAELNGLLAEAAAINGIPVIDVYSPVAAEDGSWATGLTRDGIHSNKRGSDLMAKAAHGQLPKLAG
jgi:lysophospholipase L1-like esterase